MRKEIDKYVQNLQEAFFARKMRPKFHFSSPAGWMNDPHAPVWYRGEYHLFFNYYPYDIEGVRPKCWGHAVTKDFTSYRLLPTAIAPDTIHDRDGCASGCAVVHEDRLYLLYTGRNYYRRPREVQCVAYSEDGIHFIKEKRNPVVLPQSREEMDFRDPWVYPKDHSWQMLLGGKKEGTPCLYQYESDNLVEGKRRTGLHVGMPLPFPDRRKDGSSYISGTHRRHEAEVSLLPWQRDCRQLLPGSKGGSGLRMRLLRRTVLLIPKWSYDGECMDEQMG